MNPLPVQRASQLARAGPQTQWLVEGLWSEQAVGILGGEPKCCKSFLVLDVAVRVAFGATCLRQFPVLACTRRRLSKLAVSLRRKHPTSGRLGDILWETPHCSQKALICIWRHLGWIPSELFTLRLFARLNPDFCVIYLAL